MVGCSIQIICAIAAYIESSICKLVAQKLIYVTYRYLLLCKSVCNHILFEETVFKSNFILTLLYLRIHILMHYFDCGFQIDFSLISA